jgi:hypothetical protein
MKARRIIPSPELGETLVNLIDNPLQSQRPPLWIAGWQEGGNPLW